uniref:Methyltransferase like 21e n=1 Tax=Amphiprion ocellaris TaxID=80972 RepID=A0AAQ5ZTM3_AMPOC
MEDSKTKEGAAVDAELAKAIMARRFSPSLIGTEAWEGYIFSDMEIRIKESTDLYGAVLWPSAIVLCHFLETNRDEYNLTDKNVIELGAGTGLVTIVSSLLGAKVTSTDLPDVLGNLQYNVMRNTKDRCKYIPLSLNGLAPEYLSDLVKVHQPSRALRSADQMVLDVPRSFMKTRGNRAFAVVTPTLWNVLPLSVWFANSLSIFKICLKTHLFILAFG